MTNNEVKGEYTLAQWKKDMQINQFCNKHQNWFHSGCTIQCPSCHTVGFYGPKLSTNEAGEIIRRYRACKFCGFWQEVDSGEPYRCVALYCGSCDSYDWTAPKEEQDYKSCRQCTIQFKKIDWASDNPNHVFHNVKRHMDQVHGIV